MPTRTSNAPNYLGVLYQFGRRSQTLLRTIGGVTTNEQGDLVTIGAGWRSAANYEFSTNVDYEIAAPGQPERLEGANAPAPDTVAPSQDRNVVQLFHEAIDVSYLKESTGGRFEGVQTANETPINSARDFQVNAKLTKIAQDTNYSFLRGVYNNPANPAAAALRTRGALGAVTTNVLATGGALSTAHYTDLYREMIDNAGVQPEALVALMNTEQLGRTSALFEGNFQETSRTAGGLTVRTVFTAFGTLQLALELDMPQDEILFVNTDVIQGVYLNVPGKPSGLFYEELARTGSAERGQLYGQMGFDHGPEWAHGKMTGLTVTAAPGTGG